MNVLLDTCALLALSRGDLPSRAAAALRAAPEAHVSVVAAWEVAIKVAAGKLSLSESTQDWFTGLLRHHRLLELPLDSQMVCAAAALPPIHRDPFDRILVALAQSRQLTILSSDRVMPHYPGIKVLW